VTKSGHKNSEFRVRTFKVDQQRFQKLIAELQDGSNEAAWELMRCYAPHVQAVVRRRLNPSLRRTFDSEDFVQAAWASLFRVMPRLKDLDEPKRFVGLLATIACRRLTNEVRRRTPVDPDKFQNTAENDGGQPSLADRQQGPEATPSQIAIARESWDKIVGRLEPQHKEVIGLRMRGMTYNEIAEQTGLNEKTARRIIDRATERRNACN
jgi:RNA polymerase sigma factor (sigma-70 family)